MALTLDLSISDLANARFAFSPLSETISGLQLLGNRWGSERHRRWARWAAGEVAARPLDLSLTWPLIVNDRPSWPQWLLPAPATAATTIDEDLAAMRQTTAHQVRYSLRRIFGDHPPPGAAGSTVRLLGRRRAGLLEALRSPSTVTGLARELRVSPSAVSQHLRVLRDSGLVAGERSGRSVRYLTTERGLALLDPATE